MCGDNVHLNSIPYIIHVFIMIFITGNNLSEDLRIVFAKTICKNCTIKNAKQKIVATNRRHEHHSNLLDFNE